MAKYVSVYIFLHALLIPLNAPLRADHGQEARHDNDWPFRPAEKPSLPSVDDPGWCTNEIDAFVLHKLESLNLEPNRRADKLTLLRRVTFDLIGLPPTYREQQRFLADDSPDAYAKVVDRLLASPHFGERWAQHWLDIVRYADTEGFKADKLRPNAYRYRDYVIQSFNAGRPYDEFLRQQIAGDELEPGNPDALIATGLNRLYPDEDNAANLFQRRDEILNDVTETNSLAIMALTMGCAQCHDHKFDEISQADYFRLRSFFDPFIERDDLPAVTASRREEYQRQWAAWEQATAGIRQEIDRLLAAARKKSDDYHLQKFRPEIQECVRTAEHDRTPLQEQIARMAIKQLAWRFDAEAAAKELPEAERRKFRQLKKQLAGFDPLKPEPLPTAMAISDVGPEAPPSYLLAGGNWQKPQREVLPGFPSLLGPSEPVLPRHSASFRSTGRRAALARWLTNKDHPLTARVIVNRLWQHHFGRGIVPTPNDFGVMGEAPSHPDLLDWLAVELTDHDWDLKHIHRLMVTSAAYRQSSSVDPARPLHASAMRVDSGNVLLWHARRRRLEGEAIRDALLHVTGQANFQMYGPGVRPALPEGISKRYAWAPDQQVASHARRSIYVFLKRNMRFPLFDAFDLPDLHNSCGERSTTITAPQALLMLNSKLTLDLARQWASQLSTEFGMDTRGLVSRAHAAAFGRPPSDDVIDASVAFIEQQTRLRKGAETAVGGGDDDNDDDDNDDGGGVSVDAVADFCHALFNTNKFLFVD